MLLMMSSIRQDQPSVTEKIFSPLKVGDPTQYDPDGRQNMFNSVPWTTGARSGSKMRHQAWRNETYIPSGKAYGYVRQDLNSTMED